MSTWLEMSSKKELETYLEFWKELSPFERRIFVYNDVFYKGSGQIGKIFGTKDVTYHWVGVCGCEGPIYCPKSESTQERIDNIESRWERKVEKEIGDLGTRAFGELKRKRYPHEIEFGFNWLLQDILFGNGGEHQIGTPTKERLEEYDKEVRYKKQQTALLYLNIPRLDQSVKRWLNENRPLSPSYQTS